MSRLILGRSRSHLLQTASFISATPPSRWPRPIECSSSMIYSTNGCYGGSPAASTISPCLADWLTAPQHLGQALMPHSHSTRDQECHAPDLGTTALVCPACSVCFIPESGALPSNENASDMARRKRMSPAFQGPCTSNKDNGISHQRPQCHRHQVISAGAAAPELPGLYQHGPVIGVDMRSRLRAVRYGA